MIKKLCLVGNSLGLVIEKPLLEILGIDRNTPLDISTDGTRLIIKPASRASQAEKTGKKNKSSKSSATSEDRK
jgi:antitoxin MazE